MDVELDFGSLYERERDVPSRNRAKLPVKKRKKKKAEKDKKRKKRRASSSKKDKGWDNSLSNLGSYKLSPSKQLERKLNSVSKHRHYAKDLVEEQKRKHFEQRRLEKEEKEIEEEQRQLIRRKQMLLRKQSLPNTKRAFPIFTAGRTDDDDDDDDDEEDDSDDADDDGAATDDEEFDEEENQDYDEVDDAEETDNDEYPGKDTEMTLKVLSSKLSSLENELESMKNKKHERSAKLNDAENRVQPEVTLKSGAYDQKEKEKAEETECDLTLDLDSIHKTLQAVNERKVGKPVHVTLPSMPNLSQPPQFTAAATCGTTQIGESTLNSTQLQHEENRKVNTALNSLDVPSLLMLLDKLKVYFKEIQAEKKQNEEFRSTLLESVNAQNTQILHLLSQLASQQKEIDALKGKLTEYEQRGNPSNLQVIPHKNSEARWVKYTQSSSALNANNSNNNKAAAPQYTESIALKDIKNIIEESRVGKEAQSNSLQNADWKAISSALPAKTDSFQHDAVPQQPYTVQKHARRSFLPARTIQTPTVFQGSAEDQIQRSNPPPQPVPKPTRKKQAEQKFAEIPQNYSVQNYPRVRVERYYE